MQAYRRDRGRGSVPTSAPRRPALHCVRGSEPALGGPEVLPSQPPCCEPHPPNRGCRARGGASPSRSDWRALVDGLEGVPEVVLRDLASEDDAGDAGEVVVQPRPQSGVDDLVTEVVGHVEVPHRV
jgi:hypothetical protein